MQDAGHCLESSKMPLEEAAPKERSQKGWEGGREGGKLDFSKYTESFKFGNWVNIFNASE